MSSKPKTSKLKKSKDADQVVIEKIVPAIQALSERTYTKTELLKAIDDAYALGQRHAIAGKSTFGLFPQLESEIQINALNKSLDANGQKINKHIINRHTEIVANQMKNWASDKKKALAQILSEAHSHGAVKKDEQDSKQDD